MPCLFFARPRRIHHHDDHQSHLLVFWKMAEMSSSTADYVYLEQQEMPFSKETTSKNVVLLTDGKRKARKKLLSAVITALGNFSVQYNFQAVSISLIIMSVQECTLTPDKCRNGIQASWVTGTATATIFAGAIAGQMTMGYAGDVLGRDQALTLTLGIASIGAMLSAAAPAGSPSDVYIIIIVFRFILGVGLGGVYPLSATKAAEDAGSGTGDSVQSKSSAMAFFWQVPGSLAPWLLAYIMTFISPSIAIDTQWRLLLGLGAVPPAIVVLCSIIEQKYFSNSVNDTTASTVKKLHQNQAENNRNCSSEDNVSSSLVVDDVHKNKPSSLPRLESVEELNNRANMYNLLVTGGTWFMYDICFYGVGLFGGEIIASISSPNNIEDVTSPHNIRDTSIKQLIALSMGIPSCLLTIYLLKPLGTRMLQTWGFVLEGLCFTVMAAMLYVRDSIAHDSEKGGTSSTTGSGSSSSSNSIVANKDAFFVVYCLLLFSLSGGPMVTTFILPAETFPKEVRATYNGFSAAGGKLGAVIGAYMFGPLASATSYCVVMSVCACVAFFASLISFVCIGRFPHSYVIFRNGGGDDTHDVTTADHGGVDQAAVEVASAVGDIAGDIGGGGGYASVRVSVQSWAKNPLLPGGDECKQ